jgi:3-oxoacyl-[acyl-carrier-protein] synthase II
VEQEHISAKYNLGRCYYYGNGVKQDYGSAVSLFTQSAGQGNTDANKYLAFCYAEGLGIVENYDKAIERGAKIYAEILGYGLSCDAFHITAPHPDGNGAVIAMNKAFANSGLQHSDISYISAHGTGTMANDISEAKALRKVFGKKLDDIPVSSIKSLMGHAMGAASAIEAVASVLAINESRLPINANWTSQEADMNLQIVSMPQEKEINCVLSNSFAFGGNICTVIIGKPGYRTGVAV